jgi:hypothetical protein
MSNNSNLLSTRNLILASSAVFVLSLVGMCISMLRPPDSGGLGRDSYGTRAGGYRAVVEVLEELGIPVSRSVSPPQPGASDQHTLVMLDPNARLISIGPKYVQALRNWVELGGRVVVTPSTSNSPQPWNAESSTDKTKQIDILAALGIDQEISASEVEHAKDREDIDADGSGDRRDADSLLDWNSWNPEQPAPIEEKRLHWTGALKHLAASVHTLSLPGDELRTLHAKPEDLIGSLSFEPESQTGEPQLLVAILQRGKGEIVVIADAAIMSNNLIATADNSILAVNLLSPQGKSVVFDEFYHGLSVRGNPMYLLTRPGFAAVTVGLLAMVGVVAWRSAIFLGPPLADSRKKRRDIGEYVSAMAEFFSRGQGSRRFIVREMRDGVLRQVCRELRLPADTVDVDKITAALSRRDRKRADNLAAIVRDVDANLQATDEYPRSNFLPTIKRLASCL